MQNDITVYSSKKFARNFHIVAWISAALLAFVVFTVVYSLVRPGHDALSNSETLGFIIVVSFLAILTFACWWLARKSHRSVTLKGTVLTFVEDGIQARTWSVDTAHITEIRAFVYTNYDTAFVPNRMRSPCWRVKTTDGQWRTIEFSYFEQADRDKFLPLVTELIQRPGIVLSGGSDFERVLKVWFGNKAPAVTAPIKY